MDYDLPPSDSSRLILRAHSRAALKVSDVASLSLPLAVHGGILGPDRGPEPT